MDMKLEQIDIADMRAPMTVVGFYLVKSRELKTGKNNNAYLDMTLADKSGEINAKLWNCGEGVINDFKAGGIVKISADVKSWANKLQLSINKYRTLNPDDNVKVSDLVPSAPGNIDDYYAYIISRIEMMKEENLRILVMALLMDKKEEFLVYPAAKSNHHAVRNGLIYHVYRMLRSAEALKEVYGELDIDLLNAGIIVHDLCKIDEMILSDVGLVSEYSTAGNMLGHIAMGVANVAKKADELGIKGEIPMLLEHLILSHHYHPEFGSPVYPMFLEAEMLHFIDLMDSRIYDFCNLYSSMEAGGVSDRVFALDNRRIYKPTNSKL